LPMVSFHAGKCGSRSLSESSLPPSFYTVTAAEMTSATTIRPSSNSDFLFQKLLAGCLHLNQRGNFKDVRLACSASSPNYACSRGNLEAASLCSRIRISNDPDRTGRICPGCLASGGRPQLAGRILHFKWVSIPVAGLAGNSHCDSYSRKLLKSCGKTDRQVYPIGAG